MSTLNLFSKSAAALYPRKNRPTGIKVLPFFPTESAFPYNQNQAYWPAFDNNGQQWEWLGHTEFCRMFLADSVVYPRWQDNVMGSVNALRMLDGAIDLSGGFKFRVIGENGTSGDRICKWYRVYCGNTDISLQGRTKEQLISELGLLWDSGDDYRTDIPATGAYVEIGPDKLNLDYAAGNTVLFSMEARRGGGSSYTTWGATFQLL
jgi:hypothetical protein